MATAMRRFYAESYLRSQASYYQLVRLYVERHGVPSVPFEVFPSRDLFFSGCDG